MPARPRRCGVSAICGGSYIYRQHVGQCYGACNIKDAALVTSEGSPWYGRDWTCTLCGDRWCGEGFYPRPFVRGWRQKAIKAAVEDWERGCACPVERDDDFYPVPCEHAAVAA